MTNVTSLLVYMDGNTTDRRRRYDERMKDRGHVKRTYWVPVDVADDLRDALRLATDQENTLKSHVVQAGIKALGRVARGEWDPKK